MTAVFIRRKPCEHRDTKGECHMMPRIRVMHLQAQDADHQKVERGSEGFSPSGIRGSMAL